MSDLRILVYVSHATHAFDTAALDALLARAREVNAAFDVTGMLLYHDGNFMQALEGPPEAVRHTYERVKKDRRHDSLIRMVDEPTDGRRFEAWSMGFRRPAADELPEGWSDFLYRSPDQRARGDTALTILESFRNTLR